MPRHIRRRSGRGTAGVPTSTCDRRVVSGGTAPAAPADSSRSSQKPSVPARPASQPLSVRNRRSRPVAISSTRQKSTVSLVRSRRGSRRPRRSPTAHQPIEKAPCPPGDGEGVPAVFPADPLDDLPQPLGRSVRAALQSSRLPSGRGRRGIAGATQAGFAGARRWSLAIAYPGEGAFRSPVGRSAQAKGGGPLPTSMMTSDQVSESPSVICASRPSGSLNVWS